MKETWWAGRLCLLVPGVGVIREALRPFVCLNATGQGGVPQGLVSKGLALPATTSWPTTFHRRVGRSRTVVSSLLQFLRLSFHVSGDSLCRAISSKSESAPLAEFCF